MTYHIELYSFVTKLRTFPLTIIFFLFCFARRFQQCQHSKGVIIFNCAIVELKVLSCQSLKNIAFHVEDGHLQQLTDGKDVGKVVRLSVFDKK